MNPTPLRIAPVSTPYAPHVAESLNKMMGGREVEPLLLFRTLLHNFEMGDRIRPLGSAFLTKGSLDPRDRELVIHRICALTGCEYEWGVHAEMFAKPLGMSDEWIAATVTARADNAIWSAHETLLVRLADELHESSMVSAGLWGSLSAHWSEKQLIELLMLCGWYHLIAYVANGAALEPEPWARRFPVVA